MNDTYEVNRWLGDVDEFAVYKGVLSQAEIVDHYNNGAGKYYASATEAPVVAQAPVSDYKTVSYSPPTTTLLEPALSPQMQTSTIASYTYDGDGRQVKAVVGSTTTYYVGAHYQVDNGVVTKYYFAGAQRVAMRKNGTLSYLLADHLGSTSLTTNTSGALVSELRYKAWAKRAIRAEPRPPATATPVSARSRALGCISTTQDGTTLILTSLPNLTPLYQTRIIHKTGTGTATSATILFVIPTQVGTE